MKQHLFKALTVVSFIFFFVGCKVEETKPSFKSFLAINYVNTSDTYTYSIAGNPPIDKNLCFPTMNGWIHFNNDETITEFEYLQTSQNDTTDFEQIKTYKINFDADGSIQVANYTNDNCLPIYNFLKNRCILKGLNYTPVIRSINPAGNGFDLAPVSLGVNTGNGNSSNNGNGNTSTTTQSCPCGAPTKSGGHCKRMVVGCTRCWQHK